GPETGPAARGTGSPAGVRGLQAGVAACAVLVLWWGVVRPYRAYLACAAGDQHQAADMAQALERFERAAALDPGQELYWIRLGTAYQEAAQQSADAATQQACLSRAR